MARVSARTVFTFGISVALGASLTLPAGAVRALADTTDDAGAPTAPATEQDDELAAATAALKRARELEAQAQSDLESAQADQTAAEGEVATAQDAQTRAEAAAKGPESAVKSAQATADAAQAARNAAGSAVGAAQGQLDAANVDVAEKQQAQAQAAANVVEAKEAVSTRTLVRSNALNARAAAAKGKTKADEMLAQGSYGFFTYEQNSFMNASAAIKAFTEAEASGSKIKGATNVGAAGDATSLDNLKASVRYIRECNAIRKKAGCAELLVTHYLMAVAELQLNWSAVNSEEGHSKQFNVGENLAWGYGTKPYDNDESTVTSNNPFEGWHDKEKKLYKNGETDHNKIGHYLNIVDKNGVTYVTTGFAFRDKTDDPYPTSFGQTFSMNVTDKAYDVDQYEQRLENYCSYLQGLNDAYEKAAQEAADAQAALEAAQAEQERAQAALADAKEAVTKAQAKAVECEQALAGAKEDAALKQAELDAANKELAAAQAALAPLQDAVTAAKAAVADKQKALDARKQAVVRAQNAVEATKTAATEAQKARYKLLPTVADAQLSGFKSTLTYTYGDMEQAVKLTYKGTALVEDRDFRLAYKGNDGVGTAKLTVSGSDPADDEATYQGSFTRSFKILPKGASIKKLTKGKGWFKATWKTQKIETTGYQLRYSTKKSTKGAKTRTMTANNYASFTLGGLKAKKTYYVQLRTYKQVSGKKYCSAWSKRKSVKIK